jgi:hypothetical protein
VVQVVTWDGAIVVEMTTLVGRPPITALRYATAPGAAGMPRVTAYVPAWLAGRTVVAVPEQVLVVVFHGTEQDVRVAVGLVPAVKEIT